MKLIVNKNSTLLEYLEENLDMPRRKIKEYLKYGSIYVNQVKTTKYDYPLIKNSIIFIDTKAKIKSILPFPIIYEDKNIIVVNKPSNLLTIATSKEKEETVYHLVSSYLKSTRQHTKLFIVHRLDKDTSGVLLMAKNEYTKNLYQKDWNQNVKRKYIAIVHGKPKKKEDRLVHFLKETKTNLVYITRDGKESITNYKVIRSTRNYSELEIDIETGRKNQIRVQLAHINHPIVGDEKYGNQDQEKRLYLHAKSLVIYHRQEKKYHTYVAEVPREFSYLLKNN